MPKSLIEQLPEIVKDGRKLAERYLESIEGRHRISLQTREVVFPAKDDSMAPDWVEQQRSAMQQEAFASGQPWSPPLSRKMSGLLKRQNLNIEGERKLETCEYLDVILRIKLLKRCCLIIKA